MNDTAAITLTEVKHSINQANAFFKKVPPAPKDSSGKTIYADKDGLVEFIISDELTGDASINDRVFELKGILLSITSVVTNYVNRYAEAYGKKFRDDPELWHEAFSHVPLLSATKIRNENYYRKMRGVEIAAAFLELIVDVVAGEETTAFKDLKSFLATQGKTISMNLSDDEDYYDTYVLGVSTEVMEIGDAVTFVPKIRQFKIIFDRKNSKWVGLSSSETIVEISFMYRYSAAVFNYQALENPEIKKEFDTWLTGAEKAQIEDAFTFFGKDFPPAKPKR